MNAATPEETNAPRTDESNEMVAPVPTGVWTSSAAGETFEAGRRVGERLRGGEILLLSGTLGAGKTVFTKGLAAGLGLDPAEVSSPSFTLVNRHAEGRLVLYHLDLYRLAEGHGAAHAVELEELLSDERAVIVIEWAERMGRYRLPDTVWRVSIEGDGEDPRRISIARGAHAED
ncbi:MAG: tRNA (adenosine(37)-N6)-threonylcarbamoyltransferase complex ATPase subunit type 1 TsaE [Acidobacteria bacterium]|nr:tRNA (adenosine(37)-N6)-threonylcarbamoyltransferase complex ATPase subunit type 1 TsaE [Acidobacteriota bacterium]